MGAYGYKIRNYKGATIVGVMLGIRDNYDFTPAVWHNSLLTRWFQANGLKTDKADESTRDIICIDIQFGLRSYSEEKAHIKQMRKEAEKIEDEEKRNERLSSLDDIERRTEERKSLYKKMSKDEVRTFLYENGADINYTHVDKKTGQVVLDETIHYKMFYRNPSKAKEGSVMFCSERMYDKAREWMTMGLWRKMPDHNAKIVEISAYIPLVASATEGIMNIPIEDVLIVKDQESYFSTIADIVRTKDYETYEQVINLDTGKKESRLVTKKKCVVCRENTEVCNNVWDGQALIESSVMPDWCNGMALLRNHFFKACAFRTNIQLFFMDYCREKGLDYETYEIEDMFGVKHLAKNIKIITTDDACKWLKFTELMGGDKNAAYMYWVDKVKADNSIWGIVKTDHPSKLGDQQQLSYQHVNTLPCSEEEIYKITQNSVKYVESLKFNNEEFVKYLRKNANIINSYDMFADLYEWNPDISKTRFFRVNKSLIIKNYVANLKKGKITVNGDNLTVCGNPYALLLYCVGENWEDDPTLRTEDGVIQVYTTRFDDGEFLCGIRNPHNSSNNLGYFHNVKHPLMKKYFPFSPNIMAVNCIHTDLQARMNGEDFDSDFNLVTNQPEMVLAAKRAYEEYPTVVNEVPESKTSYDNTLADYALMDSKMQAAQKAIGGSSDSAQLSQSYMWTKIALGEYDDEYKQLYDNTVILAVLAQLAIDGCKKIFDIDVNEEIKRIRAQRCMNRDKDYPKFMKYTHKIPITKNNKERPYEEIKKDRDRICNRIDESLICPMNWMQECLEKIQGEYIKQAEDILLYLNKKPKKPATNRQMNKIRNIIEDYDAFVRKYIHINNEDDFENDIFNLVNNKSEEVYSVISNIKINFSTMYRLVESSLGYDFGSRSDRKYKNATKYASRTLSVMHRVNPELFLSCFKSSN